MLSPAAGTRASKTPSLPERARRLQSCGLPLFHLVDPIYAPPASATDKIKPLLQAAQIRAAEIIEMQRPLVINLAEALLTERQLPSERLQDLLQDNQRTTPRAPS